MGFEPMTSAIPGNGESVIPALEACFCLVFSMWLVAFFCKAYAEMMVDRRGIWIVLTQAVDTTIKREVSVMYVRSVWKVKMIFTPAVTTWKRNKIFNELFVRLPDYPINKSRTTKQRNTLTKQKQRNIFTLNENCLINRLIAHCLVVLKHFISFFSKIHHSTQSSY